MQELQVFWKKWATEVGDKSNDLSYLGLTHAFEMQVIVYLDTALQFNKLLKGMGSSVHKYNFFF